MELSGELKSGGWCTGEMNSAVVVTGWGGAVGIWIKFDREDLPGRPPDVTRASPENALTGPQSLFP
jgi:hypothetical protein